ncbi:MAG: glutathione S-transferase [bacterium]|nr:glutathione S-transferase [bacterium]
MNRILDIATSTAATVSRLAAGVSISSLGARPEQALTLYEFEGCPFCRKVREALSMLDLEADILPCPKNGPRYRTELVKRAGKAQFPYLVDPNTGVEMYESNEIVRYLFEKYGDGRVPLSLNAGPLTDLGSMIAAALRPGLGSFYREATPPALPLELYSFEGSPFCRIVREELTSLEIPYRLHNVAKGSPSREAFEKRSGKLMVPYLVDPNTGIEMFESADIVRHLRKNYAR